MKNKYLIVGLMILTSFVVIKAPNQLSEKREVDRLKKHMKKSADSHKNRKEKKDTVQEAKVVDTVTRKKRLSQVAAKIENSNEINKILVLIYVTSPSQPGSDKELEKVSDLIITKLDLERPTIDGRMRTLDELIFDKLFGFEATYFYRIVLSDEIIDKYINSLKEQNHISDEQLRGMFRQVGYTYEEAREQLGMAQAIEALLNFKIRSRLVVTEKAARDFYDAHPEYEEGAYRIKKAFIPDGLLTDEELENFSVTYTDRHAIEWSMAYWLADDEITDERREVLQNLQSGMYSKPERVTGGYEVIKLIDTKKRTIRSFEDRFKEITLQLQEPQYYKMLDEFKKELLSKYELVYL